MVEIKKFKGYYYNKEKVDFQDVITPPYDVISREERDAFKAKSDFNFLHVNLNKDHVESGEILNKWIKDGIMQKDDKERIYVYQQKYDVDGKTIKRTGFVGLLKLEEFGEGVLPHEKTFDKYINERYDLMVNTQSNFGQLFMIYEDAEKQIDNLFDAITTENALVEYVDSDECTHSLWKINDDEINNEIIEVMSKKKVIIADGHHRYKTALKYAKENPDVPGNDYLMMTLVNSYNEGVIILPTNRIINDLSFDITVLEKYFNVSEITDKNNIKTGPLKYVIAKENKFFEISLKENSILDEIFKDDNQIYKDLDVAVLHKLIFNKILNISDDELKYPKLEFIKGDKKTIEKISDSNVAFFVNPPSLEQTFKIASSGKVMPQKSTYFYPKMFSGLLVNKFEEEK